MIAGIGTRITIFLYL